MKTFKLVEIAEDSEQRSEHQSMEQQVLTHLKIIQRAWVNDVHTEQGATEFIYILAHRDDGKVRSRLQTKTCSRTKRSFETNRALNTIARKKSKTYKKI